MGLRMPVALLLPLGIVTAPVAAAAQPASKIARIGYLTSGSWSGNQRGVEALRHGLRDLGYVEGQHFVVEFRAAEGKLDRLPALAAELVRLNVDVIFAGGTGAAIPAKAATRTIPIVMGFSDDPVASGLVQSLARPGGNVTGMSQMSPEVSGKRIELLKEVVPGLARVAVLWESSPDKLLELTETQAAARALGLTLQPLEVRDASQIETAFAAMTRERAGAVVVFAGPLIGGNLPRIVDLAARNRLPAMYGWSTPVDEGGLMTYGPNWYDLYRRAAVYVDKILRGAKPADLPVEGATTFELVINLRTAKALGLTIPPALLDRADRLIR
jgi:putative ABC transport system substrate-binding protein